MSDTLIIARVPLHPTPAQHAELSALWASTERLHMTLRRWLRLVGLGHTLHVREAIYQVAEGNALYDIPDYCLIDLHLQTVAQMAHLRPEDFPQSWALPAQTIRAVIDIEAKRLQKFGSEVRAGQALPLKALTRVPLDGAARATSNCTISIAGLTSMVADVWALPSDLTLALVDKTPGDRRAPHRADHVSLIQQKASNGDSVWAMDWTIRIPRDYLPRASVADTLGIDLGYRRLATSADKNSHWTIERKADAHLALPPKPDAGDQKSWHADARLRGHWLGVHRAEFEALVITALRYQQVNIEHMDYSGISDHGGAPWSAPAMLLLGVQYIPAWIQLLAPATGTKVKLIDPGQGSRRCANCGAKGDRPRPYADLFCPNCGLLDSDVNSARLARQYAR